MMRRLPIRRTGRSGLSLFELLVSLGLLAAIATALAANMGLALRVQDRTEGLDRFAEPIAARIVLRQWLGAAVPPTLLTPFPAQFTGRENGLEFTTLKPAGFATDAAPDQST